MASARSVWSGPISVGLLTVIVKLYTAVVDNNVSFANLHADCGTRVQAPRWCPTCEKRLEQHELQKSYPLTKDTFIPITAEELAQLPVRSAREITAVTFFTGDLDPRFLDKPYFVAPDKVGVKPFAILRAAMAESGRKALVKVVMRERERLGVLEPDGVNGMRLWLLNWADELRDAADVEPATLPTVAAQEILLADKLLDMMSCPTPTPDLSQYRDEYTDAVLDLVNRKAAGETIEFAPIAAPAQDTGDVMAALLASIEAATTKAA